MAIRDRLGVPRALSTLCQNVTRRFANFRATSPPRLETLSSFSPCRPSLGAANNIKLTRIPSEISG